jgi:hypothetical protein
MRKSKKYKFYVTLPWEIIKSLLGPDDHISDENSPVKWCFSLYGSGGQRGIWSFTMEEGDEPSCTFMFVHEEHATLFTLRWT